MKQNYLVELSAEVKTKRNSFTLGTKQFITFADTEDFAVEICIEDFNQAIRNIEGFYRFQDVDGPAEVTLVTKKVTKL